MSCIGLIGDLSESKHLKWSIPDFLSLPAEKGSCYASPSFTFINAPFRLCIYPRGNSKAKTGFLSVYVENETKCPCRATCSLRIKKADGTLIAGGIYNGRMYFYAGFPNFYERSVLQEDGWELLPRGILTIICTLKHIQDEKQGNFPEVKPENAQEKQAFEIMEREILTELDVLSKNLRDLSSNEGSCDIVLQVENKEFRAHKTILIARSSVFAAMFEHDTLEKQTGVVNIPDCDPHSFKEFLDYLYCGKLEGISFQSAFHLYSSSHKYNIQELKQFCMEYLMKSLTVDTFCDVVLLADKYDETKLLLASQDFFNENFNKIFLTSDWGNLLKNDYRLVQKLLIEMSKVTVKSSQWVILH